MQLFTGVGWAVGTDLGGEECVGCPNILRTSSSPNTVNIVLSVVGEVEINDILNVRNIYSNFTINREHGSECNNPGSLAAAH